MDLRPGLNILFPLMFPEQNNLWLTFLGGYLLSDYYCKCSETSPIWNEIKLDPEGSRSTAPVDESIKQRHVFFITLIALFIM